jgi:hypothetical protein
MATASYSREFVVCIDDRDVEDLVSGMVYRLIPDDASQARGFIRVVDDSGEDYLYPATRFVSIDVPDAEVQRVAAAITPAHATIP